MSKIRYNGKSATYLNKLNKITVLKLIRESKEISRAEIVKKTKLSAPTVTRIVDVLVNDRLVAMLGDGDSSGGRPPKLLKFDGTNNYVIGVDLGSTSIRAALSDLNGDFVTEIEAPTQLGRGVEIIIQQVAALIDKLINRSKLSKKSILGIGLAVAGLINPQKGFVKYSPVFKWKDVQLDAILEKHIDLPVIFDNVSRITALGEMYYGIGKRYKNYISVNVGYGIGAGIVIDSKPMYGNFGYAGEFGHIVLERNSQFVGKDGIRGSLEALASGYGIAEIARNQLKQGHESELSNLSEKELTAEAVFNAAKKGDKLAKEIIDNALQYLGQGVALLINIFDPQAIVFSGGLTKSGPSFFKAIEKYALDYQFKGEGSRLVKILPSSFQDDASLMGAFSLITSKVLNFDSEFYVN